MDKKIIFVDIDDVCARLMPVWLAHYNKNYNDSLTEDDITSWNMDQLVKPECGPKIYKYIEDPKIYDEIKPREGALEGVKTLQELKYRVVFATSAPIETAGRKFYWLKNWGFPIKEREYAEIRDKSLLKGDYMFDDSFDNVSTFTGEGCLLTRPWNEKYVWHWRVNGWKEYVLQMRLLSIGDLYAI